MELPNFPFRDQLNEATLDGGPDENANANCVMASLAAGFTYELHTAYYGDEILDASYGEGHLGGTSPSDSRVVAYAKSQGLNLSEFDSSNGNTLVATIRAQLQTCHPALGAIPSLWGSQDAAFVAANPNTSTHEVIFYGDDGTNLIAMNPWHGFRHVQPYSWWASRLVYNHVNLLSRIVTVSYTKDASGNLHYPNGVTLIGYWAEYVVKSGLSETPQTGEIWPTATEGFVPFQSTVLTLHKDAAGNFGPVLSNEAGTLLLGFWNSVNAANVEERQEGTADANATAVISLLKAANLPAISLALSKVS